MLKTILIPLVAAPLLILSLSIAEADSGDKPQIFRQLHVAIPRDYGTVDLHAHLFMKDALGFWFRGGWDEPLRATSWSNRLLSKANRATLEKSGTAIVVVALYAHPIGGDLRDSIRRQIDTARKFVSENPQWVIAKTPDEAETALKAGKQVLILSLEGAAGILENDDDIAEFIDQDGIRIVTLIHFTDDEFGGAAFLKGRLAWATPWAYVKSWFHPVHDAGGVLVNPNGLSAKGRALMETLSARHVWIDLSHASDAVQKAVIEIYAEKNWPLLYTHTILRHYFGAERAISDGEIAAVRASANGAGGIIGLLPSKMHVGGTPPECKDVDGSLGSFVKQYDEAAAILGADHVMLGSDFNSPIDHLPPTECRTNTTLDQEGLWNLAQEKELWEAVKVVTQAKDFDASKQADVFLGRWRMLWREKD